MEINEITGAVVDAAMKVHTLLGPGLLEQTYQQCLAHELRNVEHLRDGITRMIL